MKQITDITRPLSASARRARLVVMALLILLVTAAAISLMLGRYPINPLEAISMLAGLVAPIDQTWTDQQASLFFNVRLPRILLAMMVGCCLAVAGAAYQGTFQNPLVSPDILGASQGAAFGAAIAILLHVGSALTSVFAFAFALLTVLLVLLISSRARGNHMMIVVLAGVMVSSLFQAGVSYAKLIADPTDELADITYWLMGSLTGASTADVRMVLPFMLVGCGLLFFLRWRINILTMGDDEAATMGVNARRTRIAVIIAATLITAASVCVTGMIGWVGLVIPHLCRMLVGADYRRLIPASMLMGASFLLIDRRYRPPGHHRRNPHRHPHRLRGRPLLPVPHHAEEEDMSIEVSNLSFSYGSREILHDLTFSIPDGCLVNVLGPNGVGKSTLFRCILGLNPGYSGSILVNGKELNRLSVRERARENPPISPSPMPPCTTMRWWTWC